MGLLEVLLPAACAGCGGYGATLCRACVSALRAPAATADRFLAPDPGVVVGDALELAVAAFAYEGTLRKALALSASFEGAGEARTTLQKLN